MKINFRLRSKTVAFFFLLGVSDSLTASLLGNAKPSNFPEFIPHFFPDSAAFPFAFRETISVADIDKDGDLDFFTGAGMGGREYWFENKGAALFKPHVVSDSNNADVGATIADVNGDGHMDRLAGGFVYINSRNPLDAVFRTEKTGAPVFTHDLLGGDFDQDGRPDFAIIDLDGIQWFKNPGPPFSNWPSAHVSITDSIPQHGGLALGDFDSDGDLDIFRINRWYENQEHATVWVRRSGPNFGIYHPSYYGLSTRTLVKDLDKDGDQDIIQAECDYSNGRIAWFENQEKGNLWITHMIKDSTDQQDFHSLGLGDFDGDGDLDLFSTGSNNSKGQKQWYVWENLDGKYTSFQEHRIWKDGDYGGHEAVAMDVDGDGDLDLLGKKFSGYHVWMENQRITATSVKTRGGSFKSSKEFQFYWDGRILFPRQLGEDRKMTFDVLGEIKP